MSIKIYGKNPADEVVNSNKKIFKAYFMEQTNQDLLQLLKSKGIPCVVMNKQDFKKEFLGNHQGIVLDVEDYKTYQLKEFLDELDITKNPTVLVLDGITDPHNFGAIIRSAEAGGIAGIIIPKNRSATITGTVVKVASGAIEYVKIVEVTNLRNTLNTLKENGFWTIGTDMDAKKHYTEIDITTPLAIVIGSEGKGMSKLIKDTVDYTVKIDMVGSVNSLNASVSAGIIIFEILRKKM